MMRRPVVYCSVLCALLLLAGARVTAQEFRATVKGQVVDSSQAALPGATVNVRNQETNEVATATTNAEGNYTIPFLKPGAYTLTVEMSGFQTHTRKDMTLEVGQTATVNAQLGVAGVSEQVNVVSESPLLDTSNADRGTVIDSHRIAELPLQSRSPMALATLVAGVNYNAQAIYLRPFDNGALADWSMNGGANRNNDFLLDGVPNNATIGGNNIAYVPPAEAVQEFKIATNSYDAQYGRTAGGVVNMSLKSGTNTLHGVGYEFYRRKWLDANSFLLNSRDSPKTDHYLDQYGFSVDGPVLIPGLYNGKNKTFFLFTGEKYREGTPAPQFSTGTDRSDASRRFQRLSRHCRQSHHHLRSGDRPAREWRLGAGSVSQQPDSRRSHQSGCAGAATGTIPCLTTGILRSPRGRTTSLIRNISTRTCSGTGSPRSTRTSARTIASLPGGARTSATRSGTRARSGPARRRTDSCR